MDVSSSLELSHWNYPTKQNVTVKGQNGVGKSSFTVQFAFRSFPEDYDPYTEDSYRKDHSVDGDTVTLDVFDTVNNDWNLDWYYKECELFVVLFDMTNAATIARAKAILDEIKEKKKRELLRISVVVVAHKCDLKDISPNAERVIEMGREMALEFEQETGVCTPVIEASAKTGENVDDCFETVVRMWRVANKSRLEKRAELLAEARAKDSGLLDCCFLDCSSVAYDVTAIVISVADIGTDVWVLYHYYSRQRMAPFYISLSILIAAQLSYIVAFTVRFAANSKWNAKDVLCLVCIIAPISPLLSFVMYFGSLPNGCLFKWMKARGFEMEDATPRKNASKIEQFIVENRHFWPRQKFRGRRSIFRSRGLWPRD